MIFPNLDRIQVTSKIERFIESIDINFKGSMRDKQLPVIETFLKECDNSGGGIVCLPCGFG